MQITHPSGKAAFSHFRSEVGRRRQLSAEAELDLAARHRRGDRAAAHRLIEGCLGTVIRIALRYRLCGLPLEDLVQEGNIGLLRAIERFDPSHGVRLAVYAGFWIRAEIRGYVAKSYRIVRLGASKGEVRALWLYRRTREQRPEALAAMTGMSTERATELLPLLAARDVSLSPAPDDDGEGFLGKLADRSRSVEDAVGDVEDRERLRAAVATVVAELPERDQDIIRRRLLAEEPVTLEALSITWSVSKERVRQIEERAKSRLRERLEQIAADVLPDARPPVHAPRMRRRKERPS
ncbi:RNA polymerase sigma factor RpoH [Minicystis rosea]|nr:RNA polymerase sigma factor RpoH [Minicystis rosea]